MHLKLLCGLATCVTAASRVLTVQSQPPQVSDSLLQSADLPEQALSQNITGVPDTYRRRRKRRLQVPRRREGDARGQYKSPNSQRRFFLPLHKPDFKTLRLGRGLRGASRSEERQLRPRDLARKLLRRARKVGSASPGTPLTVGQEWSEQIATLEAEAVKALSIDDWREITSKHREIQLWRRNIPEGVYGGEYPCTKLSTIIHATPSEVMDILLDSSRAGEYNKYSKGRTDMEILSPFTKVVRNRTHPPLTKRPHEFCNLMHVIRRGDGTQVMMTRYTEHPKVPRSSTYARSEIILGVTEVKPHPKNPAWTAFTTVSHVKSAGVPVFVAERYSVKGMVDFIAALEMALAKGQSGDTALNQS